MPLTTLQEIRKPKNSLAKKFEDIAEKISDVVGSPFWFAFSVLVIIVWFPTRFLVQSHELWHLLINTTTTILTFLMMSLLHASQKKWERKIEQLQKKESHSIRSIETEIKLNEKNPPE